MDTSPLDRHERIALYFSGGKDSLAVLYLLRDHLHRVTVYHRDTGDLLPEVREVVDHARAMAPNFVTIQGDVLGWIAENGAPSDLVPYTAHEVSAARGELARIVPRYDCCARNLMLPLHERVKADGCTLAIRGTKRADMPQLPMTSGETLDGLELWLPILEWSHDQVFAYLRSVGAPIPRIYDEAVNAPECARCTAWWSEKRAAYLRRHHPDLFGEYQRRLHAVFDELAPSMAALAGELREMN